MLVSEGWQLSRRQPRADSARRDQWRARLKRSPSGLMLPARLCQMVIGSGLARLGGYPFEVRYSDGSLVRARAAADVAADAYVYFSRLFSGVEPDIAVIVADEADWESRQPYGLPFFNDDDDQIRPGIVVMPAGSGDFWVAMGEDLREASPSGYTRLLATYPDGAVAWICSHSSTSSRSMSSVTHSKCLGISDCRPSGWARSSPTWPSTHSSQRGGQKVWTRSRCSPSWEHRVRASTLGCAPRVTARWRISKPTTRVVTTR